MQEFSAKSDADFNAKDHHFMAVLRQAQTDNPWFTIENQMFALQQWSDLLTLENITTWVSVYRPAAISKRVGLILAGNIPLVGFHDVVSVVLSQHIPLIKQSSKDKVVLPFLMKMWDGFSDGNVAYEFVERLEDFDAVIATGSNNTARYLEYYFKDHLSIIRKNRTSVAVITGEETEADLVALAEDIFRYYGLGCRNVTRLFLPEDFKIDRLFENFVGFGDVINHNKYANNYEYNRAIYLLNQERFWDNNFVMLKEDNSLFSPLSVVNFSRYKDMSEVKNFIHQNEENIQVVVAGAAAGLNSVPFGEAQHPALDTYADHVDTMRFLEVI